MDEPFSGELSITEAIATLRKRLLDLSSSNRLINYRFPKARCVQFADRPNLDVLYQRLVDDGKPIVVRGVEEPAPSEYVGGRKPDPRQQARKIGIDVEYEFSARGVSAKERLACLRAIQYPQELERQLQKITSESRTVVEETGTNMLYLMFGFLEHYDNDDSEKPLLAPLLIVPVSIAKASIDESSRAYTYQMAYSGEDIRENISLREKLEQNHKLTLPALGIEESASSYIPSVYLDRVAKSVEKRNRWKVRNQLTLGFLSFAKLSIWEDLDFKRWPQLLESALLRQLFEGTRLKDSSDFVSQDYSIDSHPQGDIPLIADADSSQHSAIIDVLSGKDMVINGPPGTGKSQTISNLIAASLARGKKVLFVSEKLAALEVVRASSRRRGSR